MDTGFTWDTQNFAQDKSAAQEIWQKILPLFKDTNINLIVLDELTYMLKFNYIDLADVINAVKNRPQQQNIIITGRGAPAELLEIADTVSEIKSVKHAFNQGIKAQKGIEW